MIATTIGTEKLRKQLIEPGLEEGLEPKVIKLFRVGLITELRLDETSGAVTDLVGGLRENMYLLWSFVIHLGSVGAFAASARTISQHSCLPPRRRSHI